MPAAGPIAGSQRRPGCRPCASPGDPEAAPVGFSLAIHRKSAAISRSIGGLPGFRCSGRSTCVGQPGAGYSAQHLEVGASLLTISRSVVPVASGRRTSRRVRTRAVGKSGISIGRWHGVPAHGANPAVAGKRRHPSCCPPNAEIMSLRGISLRAFEDPAYRLGHLWPQY